MNHKLTHTVLNSESESELLNDISIGTDGRATELTRLGSRRLGFRRNIDCVQELRVTG